jgi:hypothetical protein
MRRLLLSPSLTRFALADHFAAIRAWLHIFLTAFRAQLLFRLNLGAAQRTMIDNLAHNSSSQLY